MLLMQERVIRQRVHGQNEASRRAKLFSALEQSGRLGLLYGDIPALFPIATMIGASHARADETG
jgi:hypothetical protein